MRRSTLCILAAWLILGPLLGAAVGVAMGESRTEEIILSTAGGSPGKLSTRWSRRPAAIRAHVLSILAGATGLMLFYDGLEALGIPEL